MLMGDTIKARTFSGILHFFLKIQSIYPKNILKAPANATSGYDLGEIAAFRLINPTSVSKPSSMHPMPFNCEQNTQPRVIML
jgi:hypothetical protein